MRTPQTRMTLALALALGTGTLAALAVGPVAKERPAMERGVATSAMSRVALDVDRELEVDLKRPM
ncbi:MAG: hypothetical protein GY825_05990, partial [Phycisphaeraceae bacterium]|nr:hypothetical protein [Phycisphaeraceae bacterium]